jgi:hypothetical protein
MRQAVSAAFRERARSPSQTAKGPPSGLKVLAFEALKLHG